MYQSKVKGNYNRVVFPTYKETFLTSLRVLLHMVLVNDGPLSIKSSIESTSDVFSTLSDVCLTKNGEELGCLVVWTIHDLYHDP